MSSKAHEHLLQASEKVSSKLFSIITQNGEISFPKQHSSLANHLCHAIISQQLSNNAASTIISRIRAGLEVQEICFPELESDKEFLLLKKCGVSRFKVKAIQSVLECKNSIENSEFYDPESLIEELTKIWGVGQWTAEMAALFYYRFEDVWSLSDAALKRGISCFLSEDMSQEQFLESFSPFKSYLALHVWKAIDTKII